MGKSAADNFDLVVFLANKTRMTIIHELAIRDRSFADLYDATGLSQSALSQHLSKMVSRGIVCRTRLGRSLLYSCASASAIAIVRALMDLVGSPAGAETIN